MKMRGSNMQRRFALIITIVIIIGNLISVICLFGNLASAGTPVSGNISVDTTWTFANSPYWVEGNVTVQPGVNLTIEPDVVVKFNGSYRLLVWGNLTAVGDIGSIITFTSNMTPPIIRDWNGISIRGNGYAHIMYCNITYANAGLDIATTEDIQISNNAITNNYVGIDITNSPGHSSVISNNVSFNEKRGIDMLVASNATIANNDIASNPDIGIDLFMSSDNLIEGNNISGSENGIYVRDSSENNNIENNTLYVNNRSVSVFTSSNNTIRDNHISNNNDAGISVVSSFDTIISGNNISDNSEEGISLLSGHRSIVTYNNFSSNTNHDIFTTNSLEVGIFQNNYFGNPPHAEDNTADTSYNDSYLNGGGNFWSDYVGDDDFSGPNQDIPGSDGIGDSWYWIDGDSIDYYPLKYPIGAPLPDTISPSLTDVTISPNPQEVHNHLNISANISDNVDVLIVQLSIRRPDSSLLGNFTMNYDSISDRYYRNMTFSNLGTFTFNIWATDTSNNWNNASGNFTIEDTTNPIANAGLDHQIESGLSVIFNGSSSWDNHGIDNYTWEFIDSTQVKLYGTSPKYEFNNIGDFEVNLAVYDISGNSDSDTVWINVTENLPPSTPVNLSVTTPDIGGELILTWNSNSEKDLAGYFVYRSASQDGPYELLNVDPIGGTTYTDSGLDDGTTYFYKVSAVDLADNESPLSDWKSGTTLDEPLPRQDDPLWLILLAIMIVLLVIFAFILLWKRRKKGKPDGDDIEIDDSSSESNKLQNEESE
jgi:parallel beta-helix repeat protein